MRILYVNKYHYLKGGAERVLLTEMELMKSRGHDVAVFASRHPANLPSGYSDLFVEQEDYFTSGWAHKAKAAFKVIYSWETLSKFGKVIDDFKPDVIHAHNIHTQLTTAALDAAKKRGAPVVWTVHDYKIICPSYLMLNHGTLCEKCIGRHYYHPVLEGCHKDSRIASAIVALEAYSNEVLDKYGSVKTFICPSGFMRTKMLDRIQDARMTVVPNPVDLSRFSVSDRNKGYYLFAGRIAKEKGVGTLVRAFRDLKMELRIDGTGPLEKELRGSTKDLPHIRWMGHCDGEILSDLYRDAYACVVPSEWYENAPLSVIEPMAYGKPVIGSRLGGIPELIRDGFNGMLFDASDMHGLKDAIARMDRLSEEEYGSLCRNARESVSKNSLDAHYEALMDIYRKAL